MHQGAVRCGEMKRLLIMLLSALAGGLLAVALNAALGVGERRTTTTIVQQPEGPPLANGPARFSARSIYRQDASGVVFVRAEVVQETSSFWGFPQQQQGEATGSGVIVDHDGTILTNAHVVERAKRVTVGFSDHVTRTATILGRDRSNDLAVLHVDPKGLTLNPLTLGSARDVQVGDPVAAIGNPFGLERTLTTGVVSAKQRHIQGLNGFEINHVIQTDAAINPGNSGGPLLDARGEVIGINSQIETGGSGKGNIGIGFAIPIDTARKLLPSLKKGNVESAYLGITDITIDHSLSALNLATDRGVLVQSVAPRSPAAHAGLRAGIIQAQLPDGQTVMLGGDVIVAVDGRAITSSQQLQEVIGAKRVGQSVRLDILRGKRRLSMSARLAQRPARLPVR